jgi:hypothetical protein
MAFNAQPLSTVDRCNALVEAPEKTWTAFSLMPAASLLGLSNPLCGDVRSAH